MDTPPDTVIGLIAPTLRCIVTLKARDMFVTTEFGRVVHADAFYRDRQLSHLLKIHSIPHLHIKLHRVKEFSQNEPYVGGLSCAVLFYHRLDFFQRDYASPHRVSVILLVVLATFNLVLKQSVLLNATLF